MSPFTRWLNATKSIFSETFRAYYTLLKILIPALLVVKLLQILGAIEVIATMLAPLMTMLGLPDLLGIVWATALLTNVFAALIVFFNLVGDLALTVENVTVLGTVILIAHSLPVEGAVARRAGVPWWVTIALRVVGALVLGVIIHAIYAKLPAFQQPAQFIWQPQTTDSTLLGWGISQIKALTMVFMVILMLITLLKIMRYLGLERWIHFVLAPLLKILGIGRAAANVTVIGVALGLSYGAGLLIQDLDKGTMSHRDGYLALCFLGLMHSVIEDTLLVMAMGADLSGILWARLLFSFITIALLARFTLYWEQRWGKKR